MPEEKIDGLEGLDDFGDDFGAQLDSFMEKDGDEESDSELDSFFEDLSTIDDLDSDDDNDNSADTNDDSSPKEEEELEDIDEYNDEDDFDSDLEEETSIDDATIIKDTSNQKENKKNKKKVSVKSFSLKPLIISSLIGLLLGVITVVLLYIFATPEEAPVPETVVKLASEPPTVVKVTKPEPIKIKPKTKTIIKTYYIQVVSCISAECVEETRAYLKRLGFKPRVRASNKSSGIAEVLSENVLGEEKSAKMVKKINANNLLAGHAFRKAVENGFRVSLGLFPELETANRVRTYLNQAFNNEIYFIIQHTTQKIRYQAVQIGGFKSKISANKTLKKLLNNNPDFQGAFVKSVVKR